MKDGKGIYGHLEAKFTGAGSWYNSTDVNSHSFHLELQMLSTPEIPDVCSDCSFYYNTVFSAQSPTFLLINMVMYWLTKTFLFYCMFSPLAYLAGLVFGN